MKARIGLIAKGDGMVFLLICTFIHTTDYHLGWYKSLSTFANELHALSLSYILPSLTSNDSPSTLATIRLLHSLRRQALSPSWASWTYLLHKLRG